jgi:hypothetical protein
MKAWLSLVLVTERLFKEMSVAGRQVLVFCQETVDR